MSKLWKLAGVAGVAFAGYQAYEWLQAQQKQEGWLCEPITDFGTWRMRACSERIQVTVRELRPVERAFRHGATQLLRWARENHLQEYHLPFTLQMDGRKGCSIGLLLPPHMEEHLPQAPANFHVSRLPQAAYGVVDLPAHPEEEDYFIARENLRMRLHQSGAEAASEDFTFLFYHRPLQLVQRKAEVVVPLSL